MTKVLITGGSGFIGSHLVDLLLKKNFEVLVIDNLSTGRLDNLKNVKDKIVFIKADISKEGNWEKNFENIDWVIHLAALADIVPSIENPHEYYKSNVTGTFNVLEASKKHGVKRFIYSASSSCYGIPDSYPTKENEKIILKYPYALTKYLGEQTVIHWSNVYKLPSISLRLFNVYGPRSRTAGTYGAVFGVFLAQKLANKAFTVVGDGNQTRDFTYVNDVVNAIYKAAKSNVSSEIFNIGSDGTYSINKLVECLEGEVEFIPKRPGEPDCTWADIAKAKRILNWRPKVSFEEGIKLLLENIADWKDAPLWDSKKIHEATKIWFKYLDN